MAEAGPEAGAASREVSGPAVLIAAQSGRALAVAARRAGYVPLVADFFADQDTGAAAPAAVAVPGGLRHGFAAGALRAALAALAARAPSPPVGLVLGSGFEDRPRLIAGLAERFRLLGSSAEAVRAAKDPDRLGILCGELAIPHPEIRRDVPASGRWLVKRTGGSGGTHVHRAPTGPVGRGHYAAAFVDGTAMSLGFVAHRDGIAPIAFARQFAAPTRRSPWRFGGVAGPVRLDDAVAAEIEAAVAGLSIRLGLRGLASADLIVSGTRWCLLEINPRPGASLDVLDCGDVPLFSAHLQACTDQVPDLRKLSGPVRGAAPVYARRPIAAVRKASWPAWVFDRPTAGVFVGRGEPIATVTAVGATAEAVAALLEARADEVRRMAGEGDTGGLSDDRNA